MLIIFTFGGCAAPQQYSWDKPGGNVKEFDVAERECQHEGTKAFYADINSPLRARYIATQIYESCLRSKGWNKVPLLPDSRHRLQ